MIIQHSQEIKIRKCLNLKVSLSAYPREPKIDLCIEEIGKQKRQRKNQGGTIFMD